MAIDVEEAGSLSMRRSNLPFFDDGSPLRKITVRGTW